jgi:hypothetical protein
LIRHTPGRTDCRQVDRRCRWSRRVVGLGGLEPPAASLSGLFAGCVQQLEGETPAQRRGGSDRGCPLGPWLTVRWGTRVARPIPTEWQAGDLQSRRRNLGTRDTACSDSPSRSASDAGEACSGPNGACLGGWTWPAPSGGRSCRPRQCASSEELSSGRPCRRALRVTCSVREGTGVARRPATLIGRSC